MKTVFLILMTMIFAGCAQGPSEWDVGCNDAQKYASGEIAMCVACVPSCAPKDYPGPITCDSKSHAWDGPPGGEGFKSVVSVYKPFVDACQTCVGSDRWAACYPPPNPDGTPAGS